MAEESILQEDRHSIPPMAWLAPVNKEKSFVRKAKRYFHDRYFDMCDYARPDRSELVRRAPIHLTGTWQLSTPPPIRIVSQGTATRIHYLYRTPSDFAVRPAPEVRRAVPVKAAAAPTTENYIRTVLTLIEFLELPGGWNSYNARPIRKENVTFAVDFLGRVMRDGTPAPEVVPTVRGGVQLEWHRAGVNLEIAINVPEEVTVFAEEIDSGREPVESTLSEFDVSRWLDRICQ